MIDKLAVRIQASAKMTQAFRSLYTKLLYRSRINRSTFHRSQHYASVADLRLVGIDAILHMHCTHGEERNHKLELIDTGEKSYSEMISLIESLFNVDARKLGVMRLDLAADVSGVSVAWFHAHTRIKYKRLQASLGSLPVMEIGKRSIETLYYGKRPNLFRIYDKLNEYHTQYKKEVRALQKINPDVTPPTFEERFRISENVYVLTRVEREMGGGRIPDQLKTVGDLANCPKFEPFDRLEFVTMGTPEPDPKNYSFTDWAAGMYLREKAEREGMQTVLGFIRRQSNRNTGWALKKFGPFLPAQGDTALTYGQLQRLYVESVSAQLGVEVPA